MFAVGDLQHDMASGMASIVQVVGGQVATQGSDTVQLPLRQRQVSKGEGMALPVVKVVALASTQLATLANVQLVGLPLGQRHILWP